MKLYLRNNGTKENWIDIDYQGETFKLLIDYPTPEQEQRLQSIMFGYNYLGEDKTVKLAQYTIKYTIKKWDGITDENNHLIDLKLTNNEMDEDQWWAFVHDTEFAAFVFMEINDKIKVTELDKKKLSTAQSLTMKTNSAEKEKTIQSEAKDSTTNI